MNFEGSMDKLKSGQWSFSPLNAEELLWERRQSQLWQLLGGIQPEETDALTDFLPCEERLEPRREAQALEDQQK